MCEMRGTLLLKDDILIINNKWRLAMESGEF
jgi:hypothetical protein